MNLRSDEPAYYLMALSLAYDGDLRCELHDIQRLRWEFPHDVIENLILMTDDGWKTVYFGKPLPIALLGAPLARLLGADGIVTTNMILFLLALWMGWRYLTQFNPEGRALLFVTAFFLLSYLWVYVFWIHTEVITATALTAALFFGLRESRDPSVAVGRFSRVAVWARGEGQPCWSGAALVVAAYHKPILAVFALPILLRLGGRSQRRDLLLWWLGAGAAAALLVGLSVAWTGHPTPYLGVERQGFRIEQYDRMPVEPRSAAPETSSDQENNQQNSWWWLFRIPEIDERFLPHLVYFLVGRHTGLFVYAPFALVVLLLWIFSQERTREQTAILLSLAVTALFFLTLIPFNWHGGGGFVGNRYFVNAYPAFLFLVTRIPSWSVLVGSGLAGLFLGPILLTPYGAMVPEPTLQAHVRNRPFGWLPFERTLDRLIPGYRGVLVGNTTIFGRSDVVLPVNDELWLGGGRPVEMWLRTYEPLRKVVFQLETIVAPNEVELRIGDVVERVVFRSSKPPGNATRLTLSPSPPRPIRSYYGEAPIYEYKVWVTAQTQEWRNFPYPVKPKLDPAFGSNANTPEARPASQRNPRERMPDPEVLVGVSLALLGEEEDLARDVYAVEWLRGEVPPLLRADRLVRLPARVKNASKAPWRARGATRVSLSYHWLFEDGTVAVWEGARTVLPRDVEPGEEVDIVFELATPRRPGRYLLELDAVRERLSWFSEQNPSVTRRIPVEIIPAEP